MPENRIYRPMVQMVRKYAILSAFILAFLSGSAQSEANFIFRLKKDTTVTAPFNNMVWMGLPVFTEYHFAKTNYEQLTVLIPQYRHTVDSLEQVRKAELANFNTALRSSEQIADLERVSKEEAIGEVIRLTNQLNRQSRKTKLLVIVAAAATTVAILK